MTFTKDHPVYLAIREQLLLGYWRPGETLRPGDIADSLHVSVSPVREALIRLAERGLASSVDKVGFVAAQFDPTTSSHYCRLMAQLYRDSLATVSRSGVLPIVARQFQDALAAVDPGQTHAKQCLHFAAACRRVLLARPYLGIVDRLGDVTFAHASATVGTDAYYQRLAGEFHDFGRRLVQGDGRTIRAGVERYFARRAAEITLGEARLSALPASTGPAPGPMAR
jgi:hypothetical protein